LIKSLHYDSKNCASYAVHTPELPACNYTSLHFINFDRSVLSKACLKDDNDLKFVYGGKLFPALMTRYTEKLLRTLLLLV